MPSESEVQATDASHADAAGAMYRRSDEFLARALGRDLQGATLRGALYLLGACAVLALIAALVR
jgi:hypothetical protein